MTKHMTKHHHRIYLTNTFATRMDPDNEWDVTFHNVRVPSDYSPADTSTTDWYVRVESFSTTASIAIPTMIVADIPNMDSYSCLPNGLMPLAMLSWLGTTSEGVVSDAVGQKLGASPLQLFNNGSLRIRVTDLSGKTLPTTVTGTVTKAAIFGVVLALYQK